MEITGMPYLLRAGARVVFPLPGGPKIRAVDGRTLEGLDARDSERFER
jgi:hypothetical protein